MEILKEGCNAAVKKMALKIKEVYVFKAQVPGISMEGQEYLKSFMENRESAPKLAVGKSSSFGGRVYWLVRAGGGENVAQIRELKTPEGENILERISEIAEKYEPEMYDVTVDRVDGNVLYGEIRHYADTDAVLDQRSGEELSSEIANALREKVRQGIVTEEDAMERIRYMREHGAKDSLILRVIMDWIPHEKEVVKPDCLYVDKFLEEAKAKNQDGTVVEILKMAVLGYGIIVKSPRGLGKLVLTKTIAWLKGQPVYSAIFSREMSAEIAEGKAMTDNSASDWLMSEEAETTAVSALKGQMAAQAKMNLMTARAASVSIVIDKSEFYKCMKDKGVMAVDELNSGDPNLVERIFNPLLDGHKKMYFPGLGEVKAERPFTVIATMNEGYEGTNEQNMATMSRFKHVILKYPKTLRDIIEASAKAELKSLGYPDVKIRKELLNQAENLYNKLFAASTGAAPLISDTALNIRGFASALVTCMVFEDSSLSQYIEDGVINVCPEMERPVLKNMLQDSVKL